MARALSQILSEITASYQPNKDAINQQIDRLDPQLQAEQQGLDAAKTDAFGQITDQSNRRGLLFSGIPIDEQAKYTGANYLPAVANLHAKYDQQKFNLQSALGSLDTSAQKDAYGIYEQELDRDAKAAASSAGGASPSFGLSSASTGGLGGAGGRGNVSYQQRADGGYNYLDASGRPISAAQYSKAAGISFIDLLKAAAASGDKGASTALGFVGNDYGYDPRKVTSQSIANLYNSLVWGTGRSARPSAQVISGPDSAGPGYAGGGGGGGGGGAYA